MMVILLLVLVSLRIEVNLLLIVLVINERKNGLWKCKFILKIVGFVILRKVERAVGKVSVFSFGFLVLILIVIVAVF